MRKNKIIGDRVRFFRKSKYLSMDDLCNMITGTITLQQLARYETDKSRWPADLLCEIAVALEVDIRMLLGDDEKERSPTAEELEAEKYKNSILRLPEKSRAMVFNMIDGLAGA